VLIAVVISAMFTGIAAGYFLQPWGVSVLVMADILLIAKLYKNKPNALSITDKEVEFFTFGMIFLFFSIASSLLVIYFFGISFESENILFR